MNADDLDTYFDMLFGRSEPGDALHHFLVAKAKQGAVSALGVPKLETSIYAIDVVPQPGMSSPDEFIAKVIQTACVEAAVADEDIHFAGLAIEAHVLDLARADREALALRREGRLEEHPEVAEATKLYAAASDGRRWVGIHVLTGPRAGLKQGPMLRMGALAPDELGPLLQLVRLAVGPDFPVGPLPVQRQRRRRRP